VNYRNNTIFCVQNNSLAQLLFWFVEEVDSSIQACPNGSHADEGYDLMVVVVKVDISFLPHFQQN